MNKSNINTPDKLTSQTHPSNVINYHQYFCTCGKFFSTIVELESHLKLTIACLSCYNILKDVYQDNLQPYLQSTFAPMNKSELVKDADKSVISNVPQDRRSSTLPSVISKTNNSSTSSSILPVLPLVSNTTTTTTSSPSLTVHIGDNPAEYRRWSSRTPKPIIKYKPIIDTDNNNNNNNNDSSDNHHHNQRSNRYNKSLSKSVSLPPVTSPKKRSRTHTDVIDDSDNHHTSTSQYNKTTKTKKTKQLSTSDTESEDFHSNTDNTEDDSFNLSSSSTKPNTSSTIIHSSTTTSKSTTPFHLNKQNKQEIVHDIVLSFLYSGTIPFVKEFSSIHHEYYTELMNTIPSLDKILHIDKVL